MSSSSATVSSSDFEKRLTRILNKYGSSVTEVTKKAVRAAANEARKELVETSPRRSDSDERKAEAEASGKKLLHYADGWATKTIYDTSAGTKITVHNKYKPTLAHLLEDGHEKRGGGRVSARVHIKPVEENISKELEKTIKSSIQRLKAEE